MTPRSLTSNDAGPLLEPLSMADLDVVLGPAGRQPTEQELLRLLPGCVGFIAGVEPISASVLAGADGLLVISRNGSGTDNIDLEAAEAMGVTVVTAAGANARGVAELTLGLILNGVRHVSSSDRSLRAGVWERQVGRELDGRTLGIVGYGSVGRQVARLALAIGMGSLVFDPVPPAGSDLVPGVRFVNRLEELLSGCDVLTLHCPPRPDGSALLGRAEFAALRRGCILVNTARWSLVDERALLEALDAGVVDVYATDSYRDEPPVDDPIVKHARTIVTPHLGGLTQESISRAADMAVRNLLDHLALRIRSED